MAGYPFAGIALKGLEPYAGKLARTVLRGRKLPGCAMQKTETVQVRNEIYLINCQHTFGTFASSDTQADASACKRAKFLPTLAHDYSNY